MQKNLLRSAAGLAFGLMIVVFAAELAFAGTTGKITGRVVDEKGNSLPGANVALEGTALGATANPDGVYFILSVPPGRYKAIASMVGYANQVQTGVSVAADFTTALNFILKETAVELTELTVVASRPPVEPDKTTSQYVVSAEDIEMLTSVREMKEVVALQAGAGLDGLPSIRGSFSGTTGHMRGGTSDVVMMVDGVPLESADTWLRLPFTGVNSSAVQEVTVISGGMAAEYGNAIGGVVNIITKEGGRDLHGKLEYRWTPPGKKHWGRNLFDSAFHTGHMKWNDPNWVNEVDPVTGRRVHERYDYTNVHGHWVEGNLSGPLGKNASFSISGKYQGLASPYPQAEVRGYYENPITRQDWYSSPANFQGSYKLGWDVRPNFKVKVGGIYGRNQTYSGRQRGLDESGRNIFLPGGDGGDGKTLFKHDLAYLSLTHTLTPKTFYELRLSWYRDARDTANVPMDPAGVGEGIRAEAVRRDKDGWFAVNINRRTWFDMDDRQRYGFKFDLTSQVTKGHLLKGGFEVGYLSFFSKHLFVSSTGSIIQENVTRLGTATSQPEDLDKPIHPIMSSWYIQDKMEFEGMVINVGLRYDRWDQNMKPVAEAYGLWQVAPMTNSFTRYNLYAPRVSPEAHQKWSPRIGVSHPITANAAVHFSYGVFAQIPTLFPMYTTGFYGGKPSVDFNKNGRIDPTELYNQTTERGWGTSAKLGFETTTEFEVGTDWNFYRDYTISLTTYYRSGTDIIGNWNPYWWDPAKRGATRTSRGALNNAFEDTKGFELSLRKAFSDNFSFQISFNQQWHTRGEVAEQRTFYIPDSTFIATGKYWLNFSVDTATGIEVPVPLTTQEIQTLGRAANEYLRSIRAGTALDWNPLTDSELKEAKGLPGLWYYERPNTIPTGRTITTRGEIGLGASRQSFGKVSFVYQTPADYGPVWGDIRVNLIYRVKTGESISVSLPGQPAKEKFGPMQTTADLAFEKGFRIDRGRIRPSFFVNVTNLFNQQDPATITSNNWYRYGLVLPPPTDANYQRYGDTLENTRWAGFPRQIEAGFKVMF